ncbi:unnamed protein product [Didymodactylos carnosus]|uniref:Uncharacterized protein n=1 Tax=Didymodactylos carnosus TaxID=1234261 RepID=A0A816DJI2_9BILA|nr:unnamed protein product [Didymodactylos carnosus]CAF4546342.1 unnamed protein product [Didymodactylos carnosus]
MGWAMAHSCPNAGYIAEMRMTNRKEIDSLQLNVIELKQEHEQLNERILSNDQMYIVIKNVNRTIEKLLIVLDFTTQMINNQNPDVLMLRLSSTKTEGTVN